MTARKLAKMLIYCVILILTTSNGQCFSPYNPDGSGILWFLPGPYEQEIRTVDRNELENLWFYDLTLKAETDTVQVTELGIIVEAHNCPPKTHEAMLVSQQNTEDIWVYIQYLNINQQPIKKASEFLSPNIPRFNASQYRIVPMGEISSHKNMFLAQFKNIDIAIKPGEKVVLSFFGKFASNVPAGTRIRGSNLVPLWSYSGKDMKFKGRDIASEYIVQ